MVDSAGRPVEGATVTGTSLSISGQRTRTDTYGRASVPWSIQKTKWIAIGKAGYVTVSGIDVDQKKPIKIRLQVID